MKFLIALVPLVALVSTYPSHPHFHGHDHPVLLPYVVNPGGIGGIYKGPDSATVIKGPDGSVIKSKQIGGAVAIDDVPLARPSVHVHADSIEGAVLHSIPFVHEEGPVIHTHGGSAGVIHAGGASAGSIHAGPVSAGSIHAGPSSAGFIHAGPGPAYSDGLSTAGVIHSHGVGLGGAGLIHAGGASAGSIHAGPVSAGSIHAGPVSAGSIHAGPSSAGSIHVAPSSAGSIHVAPSSAGSIHVGPSSAGSIHAGPSSHGVVHAGGLDVIHAGGNPPLVHASSVVTGPALFDGVGPVVLKNNPIIVEDLVFAGKDPKIVEEHVIVGNKVITVPKQVEENTDLIGPSGTISTRGGDAVISGPASITVKGGGVVSDVQKQPDIHIKTVEVKSLVTHLPAVHPVVESAGNIITQARPILPLKSIYAPNAPILGPIHPAVHPIGPPLRTVYKSGPVLTNPLPLPLSGLDLLPHYAPAYVKHPYY